MLIPSSMPRLKGYRFPREVVAYAVWGYHRFALSTGQFRALQSQQSGLRIPGEIRDFIRLNLAGEEYLLVARSNAKLMVLRNFRPIQ